MRNEEFMTDIGNQNLLIIGGSETGKTTIFKDLILLTKEKLNRKMLIMSPFNDYTEFTEGVNGTTYDWNELKAIQAIQYTWLTNLTSTNTEEKEPYLDILSDFIHYNHQSNLIVFIDSLYYLFCDEKSLNELYNIISKNTQVQFIVNTSDLPLTLPNQITELFPTLFKLETPEELEERVKNLFSLTEECIQYRFGTGLVKSASHEYNFRYTLSQEFRTSYMVL